MNGFFTGFGVSLGSYKSGLFVSGRGLESTSKFMASPTILLGLNLKPTPLFCIELSGGLGWLVDFSNNPEFTVPLCLRFGYSF
jgi:hypothetical protein